MRLLSISWFRLKTPPCLPPCTFVVLSLVGFFLAHDFINWWSHLLLSIPVESVTSANHAGVAAENIPVGPNASIAKDVISIEHFPDLAKILVTLQPNARCRRPFLRGRLSGPALVIVKNWRYYPNTNLDRNNNTNFLVEATYPTPPMVGTYFLELITVFCENVLVEREMAWNISYNFAQTCTEDATRRQLTSPNATITVVATTTVKFEGAISPGFWIHKQDTLMEPLFTRYQLPTCYRKNTSECLPPITSVEPFTEYNFQFSERRKPSSFFTGAVESSTNITTICIIGSSHARKMVESLTQAVDVIQRMNVAIQYHDLRMPFQVTTNAVRSMISGNGCERLIISVGQWPAGKHFRVNADSPWTFARFYDEYRAMVWRLYDAFPTMPTIYRSINYNPLGGLIGACPPTDWRSPAVIDGYNSVIQHVIEELHIDTAMKISIGHDKGSSSVVQFVDTDFLVGPVWDAASDWCHLDQPLALLQGVYIVEKAMLMGSHDFARNT